MRFKHSKALPAAEDKEAYVRSMFDEISPRYDLVNRIMTFGVDQSWRRRVLRELGLNPMTTLLDVASGTGDFLFLAERTSKNCVGVDFSYGMLARRRCSSPVLQASAMALPLLGSSIDALSCGFALRNFKDLPSAFAEFHRVLRPGGRLGILEVSTPSSPFLALFHKIYFNQIVPLVGGVISSRRAYSYLPQSVIYLPDATTLTHILTSAGFVNIRVSQLSLGAAQLIFAERAGNGG